MKTLPPAVFKIYCSSVDHSLASFKASPAVTRRRHYSPGTVAVAQVNVCCDVAAAVLAGINGSKHIIRFIVPQCLHPQARNCEAILYYCDFLTPTCGFPSENRSAGLQSTSLSPVLLQELAPSQSVFVFVPVCMCSVWICCTSSPISQAVNVQNGFGEFATLWSQHRWVCVCVFRRWQRIMKEGWVKIHWRFRGRTGSLKLLHHNLSQASSGLNVRYEQTPDCTLGIPPLATQIIIALTKMYVNPSKLHLPTSPTPNWV